MTSDPMAVTLAAYAMSAPAHRDAFAAYNSAELDRLLARTDPGSRILDLGCGTGRDVARISGRGRQAIGVDVSAPMLHHAHLATRDLPNVTLIRADARDLPLPDGHVDGIWSSAGLVHLDPDGTLLAAREARRVVAPGGVMAVTVRHRDHGQEPWGPEDSPFGMRWYCRWTVSEFQDCLTSAGWSVGRVVVQPDSTRAHVSWICVNAQAAEHPSA